MPNGQPYPPFTPAEIAEARQTLAWLPFFAVTVPLLFGLLLAIAP